MIYRVVGYNLYVEEDNFEKGRIPGTLQMSGSNDIQFAHEHVEGLIEELMNMVGVEEKNVTLNACGEPGRVDIKAMLDNYNCKATPDKIELWKKNKIKLYNGVYTFYIESCQRNALPLCGECNHENATTRMFAIDDFRE